MKNNWTTALTAGGIALVFFSAAKCSGPIKEDPKADRSSMAYIQCQDFVKSRLKSPTSADFPSFSSATVSKPWADKQQYAVISYVDAQNSFGAKLRSKFICEIEWNGQSATDIRNWKLNGLMLD